MFQMIRKDKEKYHAAHAAGDLEKRRIEHTSSKCFRCGYEDNQIAIFLKPPKENEKRRKQLCFNKRVNPVS